MAHLALLTFAGAFALSQVGTAAGPAFERREWTIDGVTREALVSAPHGATKVESPLVFVFHGHGGTARNVAARFSITKHWPAAVAVYMQGLPTPGRTDPEGKQSGWQRTAGDQNDRDLKFFDAVVASMKKDYKIDERRIYATGHSNGGGFTYLLWRTRGDLFAAVAPSSSGGAARNLDGMKPKPALHLAGETDAVVPFENQKQTMQAVRRLNGCEETGKEWAKGCTLYPSATGTPFVAYVHPGGHTLPAEAPELIVKFFKEFPKGEGSAH